MTNKATKYGLMTIAAVLLVVMAFAGAASADDIAPEPFTNIYVNGSNGGWDIVDIPVACGYYIKNESNWRYVVDNVNTNADSIYKSANLTLTDNIVFTDDVNALGTYSSTPSYDRAFKGTIYGNGYQFVNLTQLDEQARGLIDHAGDGCILNYVQLIDSNITVTSAGRNVGGLIGSATPTSEDGVKLLRCSVKLSNLTSCIYNVGGLVGEASGSGKLWINASCVGRVYVVSLSQDCTGGLVGDLNAESIIVNSQVNECEIGTYRNYGGGLVGRIYSSDTMSIIQNTTVRDCYIWIKKEDAGGLIGYVTKGNVSFDKCVVDKCTLVGTKAAGFIGGSGNTGETVRIEDSQVKSTWIDGTKKIGSIFGQIDNGYLVVDNILQTMVINSTNSVNTHQFTQGIDNRFNGSMTLDAAYEAGVGSQIGKALFAGKDYGYGSAKHVMYVANGATSGVAPSKQTYAPSSTVTVADKGDLAKDGYNFRGWYNESVGLLKEGATFAITEDVTLYANWSILEYNITYNNMSGATNPEANPTTYNVTSSLPITLENAYKIGYTFENWYNSTEFTEAYENNTIPAGSTGDKVFYANWTLNKTNIIASDNKAEFGNDNVTAIHSTEDNVIQVLLENVSNVDNSAVNFTADNTSVGIIPPFAGYSKEQITAFDLNASAVGTAKINITVTFANETIADANKDNVRFFHYVGPNWELLNSTIAGQNSAEVLYTVETTSFSPFGIGIYTPITYTVHFDANGGQGSMDDMTFTYDEGQNLTANAFQRYNSNFLYWTYNGTKYYNTDFVQNLTTVDGYTVEMVAQWETYSTGGSSSGSTYMGSNSASYTPTQQPTVKPTVAPTAAPTEKPATPTVIATEKPTTQATQQSPAPFVGLLAGLGAAAVLLRLKK